MFYRYIYKILQNYHKVYKFQTSDKNIGINFLRFTNIFILLYDYFY